MMNTTYPYHQDKFKMPGLGFYWMYSDGRCYNIRTERFLEPANGAFRTYDDHMELSPITPEEIQTYYKHLMAMFERMQYEETETIVYRPYPIRLHAIVDSDGKEVMILNSYLLDVARKVDMPVHYKIVKY